MGDTRRKACAYPRATVAAAGGGDHTRGAFCFSDGRVAVMMHGVVSGEGGKPSWPMCIITKWRGLGLGLAGLMRPCRHGKSVQCNAVRRCDSVYGVCLSRASSAAEASGGTVTDCVCPKHMPRHVWCLHSDQQNEWFCTARCNVIICLLGSVAQRSDGDEID